MRYYVDEFYATGCQKTKCEKLADKGGIYRTPADVRLLMASVMEKVCERKPGATWSSSTAELEKSLSSVRPHRHQNV